LPTYKLLLDGPRPERINQRHIPTLVLSNGPAMREAQATISGRIVKLLGTTLETLASE